MPLLILHPDKNGKTALDKAISNHRPKSFKCMVDLLSDISIDFCLSKLMLNIIPLMIDQGTFSNHQFFEESMFQPLIMQSPLIIQWPDEQEDFIFPSHTSLIGLEFILDKLIDTGHLPESLRG